MDALRVYFKFLIILPLFFSCADTKTVTYFNELTDQEISYKAENLEPVIQKNDLLSISVTSMNGEANQLFNLYNVSSNPGNVNAGSVVQAAGFLVDQDGNISFPMLGSLKVAGLTKKDLKELITQKLKSNNLLFEPVVNIRYLNYKVTVLGEVAHPSVYNVPGEKVSLLEALGLAGDLTIYARRDNVLIIREEEEGKRISKHVNLNANDLLTSPYYYLKSNDVVYVAPGKAQVASTSTAKIWLPSVLAGLSFIAIILTRVF
ncbi:polysaccharide biosynthesis/export family protein [soil metagenome]